MDLKYVKNQVKLTQILCSINPDTEHEIVDLLLDIGFGLMNIFWSSEFDALFYTMYENPNEMKMKMKMIWNLNELNVKWYEYQYDNTIWYEIELKWT